MKTKITRTKVLRYFLEWKRNRIERVKDIWEMYRKTVIERREMMN